MRTLRRLLAHPAALLSPHGISRSPWPARRAERRSLPRAHRLEVELLEERSLLAPVLLDPSLDVRTVVSGLTTPTTLVFLGDNDFLVLEKNTGNVKHVVDGVVQDTALSLPINFNSERGMLGSALDPNFASNHNVYLYWTQSMSGQVSGDQNDVPLLGNRVDRFIWDGSTLTFDRNLITLHAWQPPNPPFETGGFGNHNGGILKFGPDGKLYIVIGDNGRRGWMQNITHGVAQDGMDDQFGGPEPDNAHLTGVVLRLNPDGSTPDDNPFFNVGAQIGGEVGANIQKVFAYGVRNTFGMEFDPFSGHLWMEENGDDSFDKVSRVDPGSNDGWIQSMGPLHRIREYKGIETTPRFFGLQQTRWPPTLIADTPQEALARMFMLPGAHYNSPRFSWRYAVPPAGVGFLSSTALGAEYFGDFFVGAATTNTFGGHLFRFKLSGDRQGFVFSDPQLQQDPVADNFDKNDIHGSETLEFGRNFGIGTDIQTAPNGNLWVVSLTDGAVYEVFRRSGSGASPAVVATLLQVSPIMSAPGIAPTAKLDVLTVEISPQTPTSMRAPTESVNNGYARAFSVAETNRGWSVSRGETGVVDDVFTASPIW